MSSRDSDAAPSQPISQLIGAAFASAAIQAIIFPDTGLNGIRAEKVLARATYAYGDQSFTPSNIGFELTKRTNVYDPLGILRNGGRNQAFLRIPSTGYYILRTQVSLNPHRRPLMGFLLPVLVNTLPSTLIIDAEVANAKHRALQQCSKLMREGDLLSIGTVAFYDETGSLVDAVQGDGSVLLKCELTLLAVDGL